MTAKLPFTQAGIRRRIAAARAEGLRITGIAVDGTVLVDDGKDAPAGQGGAPSKWADDDPASQWAHAKK